ncbi:MAG: methyltransferase domain-containing protein [Bryobacteraceae bacterium]|jgi:glycosyltransferase involved in cell wall biosynthesis/SAM-dependent methyltransferase
MRVAFFSPLPPARSGIADYSAALIESLRPRADLAVFSGPESGDPADCDVALYQIGNNGHHGPAYQTALRHPGVVVLHESNLHHLVADLTIKRGDWDAYLAACEYEGGAGARAFAERVRRLETGPDYEGLKMTRRLLESARGVIVHSRFMADEVRSSGYSGPLAVIPHGAWIPETDRNAYRRKLGLDEATPLAGIFGFLKPYKRIPESLRAFRRLVRLVPEAKMILAGEPHPDLPLGPMIQSMDLSASVRALGFVPIEDFQGYLGACDIVLNLRHPTVGESSGTLLRALGLGKAVLASDVGSFHELPDDVCVKVPVGPGEEDSIFEYLNLLVSRPDVAREIGARAREYVARECNWDAVAARYAAFLEAVAAGREWSEESGAPVRQTAPAALPGEREDLAPYVRGWAAGDESLQYVDAHQTRLAKTLEMVPPGGSSDRILEMGAYLQITPALRYKLGYGEVRGSYYGPLGRTDRRVVASSEGEPFACEIDHFDASKDPFPYPDGHFSTVLCCEVIEHLSDDPMHLMSEVNRILRPGGHLLLTTPNVVSLRAIAAVLQGHHPGLFPAYIQPVEPGVEAEARHSREYAPREIRRLLTDAGFEVVRLETGEFRDEPRPEYGWVAHLLDRYRLHTDLRGDGIYALGRKTSPVKDRRPRWLYQ